MPTTGNILVTSFAPRSRSHGARHVTARHSHAASFVMCYGGRQPAVTQQIVRGEAMMVPGSPHSLPGDTGAGQL